MLEADNFLIITRASANNNAHIHTHKSSRKICNKLFITQPDAGRSIYRAMAVERTVRFLQSHRRKLVSRFSAVKSGSGRAAVTSRRSLLVPFRMGNNNDDS